MRLLLVSLNLLSAVAFAETFPSFAYNKCSEVGPAAKPPKEVRVEFGGAGTSGFDSLEQWARSAQISKNLQEWLVGYMAAIHDLGNAELYNPNSDIVALYKRILTLCDTRPGMTFAAATRSVVQGEKKP